MTKVKGKKAGTLKKLSDQVKEAEVKAEQSIGEAEQSGNVHPHTGPVMVTAGGTKDKPSQVDAASYAPVTPDDIKRAGEMAKGWKEINVRLTMNLLSGKPLARDILNKDSEIWTRDLRTDKHAFFGIFDASVLGKITRAKLVDAWEKELRNRKRYDLPTLQALYKAVMAYLRSEGIVERRVSPMEKFARACLDIMNNRTLTQDEIMRQVRAKLTEAANYSDTTVAAPAEKKRATA